MNYKHLLLIFILYNLYTSVFSMTQDNIRIHKILVEIELKTGKNNSIQSRFVQKKKLGMFAKEIIIEGMCYIQKPNLFAWHVYKPVRYGLVVKGSEISQWNVDTNCVKTISMKNNPGFKAIFKQMNKWLSGNYKSLMDEYHVSVVSEKPLLLEFSPLESADSFDFLAHITIQFNRNLRCLEKIIVLEKSGDKTTLSFFDTKLNEQIPSRVWKAKF